MSEVSRSETTPPCDPGYCEYAQDGENECPAGYCYHRMNEAEIEDGDYHQYIWGSDDANAK